MTTNSGSWYVPGEGNQPTGPFTAEQIIESWRAGRLNETTLCWQEGMVKWLPLTQIEPFAATIRSGAAKPHEGSPVRRLAIGLSALVCILIVGGVAYVYWKESADIRKANKLLDAEQYDEASKLLKSSVTENKLRGRDAAYLLALSQTRKYASEPSTRDIDGDTLENLKKQFQELFQADEGWRKRAQSDLADIISSVPSNASDSIPRSVTLGGFLEQLSLADSKQLPGRLLSKAKEIVARGHQSISEAFDATTVREIVRRDSSLMGNILAVLLPESAKPSLVSERVAIIQRWAQEQSLLAVPLAGELVNRADDFVKADNFDLADLLVATAEHVCPKEREQYARKRIQFVKTRLGKGDFAGVVHILEQFRSDLAETQAEIASILLQCSNELIVRDPQEFRNAMAILVKSYRKMEENDQHLAKYLYGAYLWLFESKRHSLSVLRTLPPDVSLPCLAFVSKPIETGTYPVNREVKNDNVGFSRDFTLAISSIEVPSAEEIAVNITLRNHTRGKQTFFVPMTDDERKRQADELEKSVFYGRHGANELRSRDNDFYLLDDLGNKVFPKNTGSFFKKWGKKERLTSYYVADMDPGQEWDDRLVFPMVGIGSSSVTFVLAAQLGHRPEVKFADIILRKVQFGKFPASDKRVLESSKSPVPILVEAPWAKPAPADVAGSVVPHRSGSSRGRGPIVPRPGTEENLTTRSPAEPSSAESPLSKGPLSGTWQDSTGGLLRIDDDGKTANVELLQSDALRAMKGNLIRPEGKPDAKALTGTFDATYVAGPATSYTFHVKATLDDDNHIRIRSTDCPVFVRGRIERGNRSDTWTRSDAASEEGRSGRSGPRGGAPPGMAPGGMPAGGTPPGAGRAGGNPPGGMPPGSRTVVE